MKIRVSEIIGKIIGALVLAALVVGSIAFSIWQFELCYPEVSDNIWYCIQHAY